MNYYVCIRESIQKFDELLFRIAVEGGTFSLALLSLSGIFFSNSFFLAALIVTLGSILTTFCFSIMAWFYSKLLGEAVNKAQQIEKELLNNESGLTCSIENNVKFFGRKVAGVHTWKVVMLEFVVLFLMALILFFFYLWQFFIPGSNHTIFV
jgi:hypothetical protein